MQINLQPELSDQIAAEAQVDLADQERVQSGPIELTALLLKEVAGGQSPNGCW